MSTQVAEPTGAASAPTNNFASSAEALCNPDDVAIRAYEIYCGRGCEHGRDVDDWIEAERQLREELASELQDPGTA